MVFDMSYILTFQRSTTHHAVSSSFPRRSYRRNRTVLRVEMQSPKRNERETEKIVDDSHNDDSPQGCWRTLDGIGHTFDDEAYAGGGCKETPFERWKAFCGACLENNESDFIDKPTDCMTCIVLEARHAAA